MKQAPAGESASEVDVKPDVKPPRRLATTYLGQPGLLRMLGAGDEDHIITKVFPGTDRDTMKMIPPRTLQ